MNSLLQKLLLLLPLATAGCGGGLISGDAQVADVCKQLADVNEPAAPNVGVHQLSSPFTLDIGQKFADALGSNVSAGDVTVRSLTLHLSSGPQNFSFVETAAIDVAPAGNSSALTRVFAYSKPTDGSSPGDTLTLQALTAFNVLQASASAGGKLPAVLTVNGTLPQTPWVLSIKPCFNASVKFKY